MKNKLGEFKFILLLIFLGLYSFSQTDVKINLFTAPFLIPNFAFEIPTKKNQSVQLDVLASFWNEFSLFNDEHFLVNQTFLEYRWYKNELNQGWFIGPNIGYGMFTFNKPDWAVVREFPGLSLFYYLSTLPQTMNIVLEEHSFMVYRLE